MYAALFSMFYFITLYLQEVLHQSALVAGLSFLPMTLSVFSGSWLAPRLVARFGVRPVVTAGMLIGASGLLVFTSLHPGASYFALVLPGAIPTGLGMGLGLVSSTIAATQGVPKAQSGLASGLLNMARLFGGAVGLAVLGTLAAGREHPGHGVSPAQALTNGYGLAFKIGVVILLAAAAVAMLQLRPAPEASAEPAELSERELDRSEQLAA
jgi:MFS family permease